MNDITLSQKRSKTRIFNPHRLKSNELEESFIARQELFHSILDDLASGKSKSPPQHQLVIGQRGMGKTTLLLRLALELHREPYCQHLLPLNFPEEQYIEVDRLSKFWLNCLDATADALEYEGKMEVVTQIDGEVQRLSQMQTDETTYHESCREAFTAVWKRLGRRPVLFIDNFNLLLSRLRKEDFSLRGYFSAPGAPVLVAASTVYPDEMADYGAAFYDGFKPHYLHPLTLDGVRDVLIRLAQSVGQPVLVDRIYRELPRLAALRDLTGGNPRTAVLLFELFADGFSEDAFEDLDALLDLITPLYQSRLEQLSDLAQTIVGTLARNWSPMSKADIVGQARLVDSSVPAQLGRLREIGLVEETPLFPSKKTGYQIAERFFNIWYLMRFASRRQRASLGCLTRFLEEFHTPAERTRSAHPSVDVSQHNLAFLLRDNRHEHAEAKSILRELRQPDEWRDTQALHEALFAAYKEDWPQISKSMKEALSLFEGRLPSNTRDDWFRASAVLLHLGFGERLVGLLKECGADVTLMPWFAAVQAHTLGDKRHSVNIPLEARPAAEQIFDQIDQRRQQLPPPSK
jgi:hypothetical protein